MREVVDEGCHGKDEGWNNVLEGFNVQAAQYIWKDGDAEEGDPQAKDMS